MSSSDPTKIRRTVDRRANSTVSGPASALRKVKGAFGRPIEIERKGGSVHVVLVDRRRAPSARREPSVSKLRAELRTHLLDHDDTQATQVMRHLIRVHDQLGNKGWAGVETLSARVIGLAQVQAEMLSGDQPSPLMQHFIDQLRTHKAAAEAREDRKLRLEKADLKNALEVTEATREEFDAMSRDWVDSIPLAPHGHDADPSRT